MKTKLSLIAAAALATGLIAAGCGGDDDESSDSGTEATTLTKAEFITEADAICAQGNQEIDQAFQTLSKDPSQAQFDEVVTVTVIPSIQGQIDDIRALGAPEGDEDQISAALDSAQEATDKVEEDPSILNDPQGEDPYTEAEKLLREYGITKCG